MYRVVGQVRTRLSRVTWMLEELEQPYEIENVRPHSARMKQLNPTGKVPVLIDENVPDPVCVIDSAAICIYLADRHPDRNMSAPPGSRERAAIDSWVQFAQNELDALLWFKAKHKFILPEELRLEGIGRPVQYEFDQAISGMEARLGDNEFAIGDRMTAADVLLGHVGAWARIARMHINSDRVNAYFDRLVARPAFARAREVEKRFADRGGL